MVDLTWEDVKKMKADLKQYNCELLTLHGDFWKACRRKINSLKKIIQEAEEKLDGADK